MLHYIVSGDIEGVLLPHVTSPERTDGLWQHTCFEAFVRAPDRYYEFNFSHSTEWAVYRFNGYREGMSAARVDAPRIETMKQPGQLDVQVTLDLPADARGRLAISAIIEELSGDKSYWALGHPPGKADFHHQDGFTLELPAIERP